MNADIIKYMNSHSVLKLRITHEMFYEHVSTDEIRIETRSVYSATVDRYMVVNKDGTWHLKKYDAILFVLNEGENPPCAIVEVIDVEYHEDSEKDQRLKYDEDRDSYGMVFFHIRKVLYVSNESVISSSTPSNNDVRRRCKSLSLKIGKDFFDEIKSGKVKTLDVRVTDITAERLLSNEDVFFQDSTTGIHSAFPKYYDSLTLKYGSNKKNPCIQIEVLTEDLIMFEESKGTYAIYDTLYEGCLVCKVRYHLGNVVKCLP